MKRQMILGLLAGAALLAAACGKPAASAAGQPPHAGRGAGPGGPIEVGVVTLRAERVVLTTELPGRTAAYLIADVRPQVNGIIQERRFVEGSTVQKGALLYQIDPAPYEAAFEQAKAALAVAEANLPPARSRAERLNELVAVHAVGQQDADEANAALARAEASIASARASVETARINLSYTPLKAPISGRTGRSAVTPGALVSAYQPTPLVTIQQLDPIYVDVTQSSAELLRRAGTSRAASSRTPGGRRARCGSCSRTARRTPGRAGSSSATSPWTRRRAPWSCAWSSRTPTRSCCPACSSGRLSKRACSSRRFWHRSRA